MGCSWINFQDRALDNLRGEHGRVCNRHDLIVVAMNDQGRNIELLEIFGEIRLREDFDAVECTFETNLH